MDTRMKNPWWRKAIEILVRYLLPIGVSVGLVVWLFHKVDIHEVMHIIRTECSYGWIVLMMFITMLSHIVRGIRWGIQLRGAGVPRMGVVAESVSIFGAYALNLVLPRLGEVWRCVWVAKREKVPLSTVIGTDIGDRGSDAVVVIVLTCLALIVAHPAMMSFLDHYRIGHDIMHYVRDPFVWSLVALLIFGTWAVCHFFNSNKYIGEFDGDMKKVWDGFRVMFHMKGIGWYVVLTLGIWTCYYLETYVSFYAFGFTRTLVDEPGMALGLIPGLVVFVFGSFSMAVPSNGGLGPWNLAVMFALSLYGISDARGTAFSLVMWGSQAAMLVMLGIFSAIYVMVTEKKGATA